MSIAGEDSPSLMLPKFGPQHLPTSSHLPSVIHKGAVFGATPQLYQAQCFCNVTLLRWMAMNHGHVALLHLTRHSQGLEPGAQGLEPWSPGPGPAPYLIFEAFGGFLMIWVNYNISLT